MGGSSKSVTVGYKYYLGMHMVLCHGPVDRILEVRVDGKTAWSGNSTGGAISINSPDLFGGESREGGITGTVDIDMGRATQGANSYLTSKLGAPMPAFRGVVGAVLRQVYIGLNPYLKRWSWVAQRLTTRTDGEAQWYSAKAAIGEDMNPAHIIYECLTDRDWGMGYLASDIDVASFTAAADKLYSEGMGISLIWDKQKEIEEFIGVILKHVDGVLYVDRVTGLFTFRLTRGDYDRDSLLVFDESNIISVDKFNRPTYSELINSVTVVYKIARSSKNNAVTVQDIALAQIQNATIGTTIQYPGFRNGTIAAKVCARDLAARSTPLVFCTLQTTRAGTALNIGDVFRLSWPQYGLADVVMRVTNIQIGADPTDQKVKVDCVQDIFDLNDAVYAAPPVSEWEDPVSGPQPVAYRQVYEVPYYEVASRLGDSAAQGLNGDSAFLGVAAVAPTGDSFNARIWVDAGSGYADGGTADFCPTATLSAEVGPTATVLPISNGRDLDMIETGGYAFVGSGSTAEAVEVVSWTDTTVTVKRGVLDTVPRGHLVGSRIWFVDPWSGSDEVEYLQGDSLDVKLTPTTGKGTLAVTSAPADGVTFVGRLGKPYPPGQFRLNSAYYPNELTGQTTISWAHRDRLQQTAGLIDYLAGNIGPEEGTNYRVRIYDENDVLLRTLASVVYPMTLANGDAELGNVTGWTQTLGTWTAMVGADTTGQPYGNPAGGYLFYSGNADIGKMFQAVQPVAQGVPAADIDTGTAQVRVTWTQGTFRSTAVNDDGRVNLRFKNASNVLISESLDSYRTPTTPSNEFYAWNTYSRTVTVPAGTRYIEIELESRKNQGGNNDGLFDNIRAEVRTGVLNATSVVYPVATEIADAGREQAYLRFELDSVRGDEVSYQFHNWRTHYNGWGLEWGDNWGGDI